MPVGGARPGAGRPKGRRNTSTEKTKAKAAKSGPLPLEILLDIARYHHARALKARAVRGKNRDEALIRAEHAYAKEAADKAAGFLHSRLATTVSQVNINGRLSLEQHLDTPIAQPANSNTPKSTSLDTPIGSVEEIAERGKK